MVVLVMVGVVMVVDGRVGMVRHDAWSCSVVMMCGRA